MIVTFLDKLWIQAGLQREELRRERGRGVVYAILGVAVLGSTFLAADLVLNMSGRFS
ncbi:hypothetical protein HK107_06310 [Parvularcula sp. ZS-1/3]|uniref:Uncharacterized protein n=1 Tax=Parvularcula mediterranea TaxID=2732508 RepID=A0A7Y3W4N2_9PROT|nr:hypothetical protein [Parvularcula mediterranea]NNU15935.1 hypothetical protein [Parvularcula mediterranea]